MSRILLLLLFPSTSRGGSCLTRDDGARLSADGSALRRAEESARWSRGQRAGAELQKAVRAGEERTGGGQRVGAEGSARGRRAHRRRAARAATFPFYVPARALALDSRRLLAPFFLPNAPGASESSTGRRFNGPGDDILSTVVASMMLEDSARPDA
jgi:hypothetical protein